MIRKYALEGVRTYEIKILPDERGFFSEALRQDWSSFIDEWVVQVNMNYSYPNVIRAWHKHLRGQVDYFLVLKGAMKICAFNEETKALVEVFASEKKLMMVRIPGHYYHGFKSLGNEPCLMLYFVNRLYDPENPDEQRILWNDARIVPSEINGNKKDQRVNQPWDWFYPPHK